MNWYLVLLKVDPNHTDAVVSKLKKLPKNPGPEITLNYSYFVFGTWDACIWFWGDNHDDAMSFVQRWIRNIPWVTETYVMPTSTIKYYK